MLAQPPDAVNAASKLQIEGVVEAAMLRAMRVPLLDLKEEYRALHEPICAAIDDVLRSQQFILGPNVSAFEEELARYNGAAHGIGVSSGTDALLAILIALGIGPGDAVITTAYTFFATAACIARVGATPIFVDIDENTFNISPDAVAQYLERNCRRDSEGALRDDAGRRMRAIVPVHLFGLCCEMDALQEIARQFDLLLIEDAAQAIGAEYPSGTGVRKAGTMGDAGYFSFYPSKNLGAAGDAGLIVTDDDALAHRLRICRQHGMEPRYIHHFIGGNFRLDDIQAAILRVKLPLLDEWSAARRRVADFYRTGFEECGFEGELQLPPEPFRERGLTNHHIYHQFVVRTKKRDALQKFLAEHGIGTAIYYPLGLHEQRCFDYLGYRKGDLPKTEQACAESLALPIYPALNREQQEFVIDRVAQYFRGTA